VENPDKKTRVLFLSRAYRPDAGGMERLSYELINNLRKQPQLEAMVVGFGGARRWFPLYFTIMMPWIIWQARRADIVHLGDPLLADIGWLLQRVFRVKVAVTVHGLDVSFPHPLFRAYQRIFFSNFDLYLPISAHAAVLLEPWRVTGVVRVINPGVSDRFYDPTITRDALSDLLKLPTAEKTVLLTVGRLVRRKGHTWFIQNVLPRLSTSVLYVIAGMGEELERISEAAVSAGVADQVRMLGRVTEADLKILYNTVDTFIQPNITVSGDAEGFGLVMLEAALCGTSVIASEIDGIPDAIQNGKNGQLLPAGAADAWVSTLSSSLQLISDQRAYSLEQFGWTRVTESYASALRSMVQASD